MLQKNNNDARNPAFHLSFSISSFFCIFSQINASLVSKRAIFQIHKKSYQLQTFENIFNNKNILFEYMATFFGNQQRRNRAVTSFYQQGLDHSRRYNYLYKNINHVSSVAKKNNKVTHKVSRNFFKMWRSKAPMKISVRE